MTSPAIANGIAGLSKELAAALEVYSRMPKLRDSLACSASMLLERLNHDWETFVQQRLEEKK
jgi:hypothetical protein